MEQIVADLLVLNSKKYLASVEKMIRHLKKSHEATDNNLLGTNEYLLKHASKINNANYLTQMMKITNSYSEAFNTLYFETIEAIKTLNDKMNDANLVKTDKTLIKELPNTLQAASKRGDCFGEINNVIQFLNSIRFTMTRLDKFEKSTRAIMEKISRLSDMPII